MWLINPSPPFYYISSSNYHTSLRIYQPHDSLFLLSLSKTIYPTHYLFFFFHRYDLNPMESQIFLMYSLSRLLSLPSASVPNVIICSCWTSSLVHYWHQPANMLKKPLLKQKLSLDLKITSRYYSISLLPFIRIVF